VTIGCGLQSKRYWLAGMAVGKLGRACTWLSMTTVWLKPCSIHVFQAVLGKLKFLEDFTDWLWERPINKEGPGIYS
jgi:hypothetical protein